MKPKKPTPEFIPEYSANFIAGFTWLHYSVEAFTQAFMSKGSK